jgi:hypothetical protein
MCRYRGYFSTNRHLNLSIVRPLLPIARGRYRSIGISRTVLLSSQAKRFDHTRGATLSAASFEEMTGKISKSTTSLEIDNVARVLNPSIEQSAIAGLHSLEAALKLIADPTRNVLQVLEPGAHGHETAGRLGAGRHS